LDMQIASLGEPVGYAMFSVLTCGVNLGDTAVVLGTGFAGLIMVQGLKKKSAYKVIAVDKSANKLALARQLGADVTLQMGKVVQAIITGTEGRGADIVIEAAGTEETINTATAILKHNGILTLYSYVTQPVTLHIGRWHDDAFDIRTTCLVHHTENERQVWVPWALRPVVLKQIDVKPLISHVFLLEQVEAAFKEVIENPEAIKVMLRP
jgi:threonine dehydrogenase-like Zn-dependent dehydrogenase